MEKKEGVLGGQLTKHRREGDWENHLSLQGLAGD
jgi:hypothetical protein